MNDEDFEELKRLYCRLHDEPPHPETEEKTVREQILSERISELEKKFPTQKVLAFHMKMYNQYRAENSERAQKHAYLVVNYLGKLQKENSNLTTLTTTETAGKITITALFKSSTLSHPGHTCLDDFIAKSPYLQRNCYRAAKNPRPN